MVKRYLHKGGITFFTSKLNGFKLVSFEPIRVHSYTLPNININHLYYKPDFRRLQSKIEGKDQESIQSSTTTDPGYQRERDNFTIRHQEVSAFPAGDHKASIKRHARKHNKNKIEIT